MENWVKILEFDKNEYNNPNNIVYEDTEELKNTINDDEGEEREYNKRNIAKKNIRMDAIRIYTYYNYMLDNNKIDKRLLN